MASCEAVLNLNIVSEAACLVKPFHTKSRTLYLTNLDQLFNYHRSLALYYAPCPDNSSQNVATVLKDALQQLLFHYPFAAGRLRFNQQQQRLELFCNSQGAQFVSASSHLQFADLGDVSAINPSLFATIHNPHPDVDGPPLVAVQVTRFSCGGFVLSITFNHALFDGSSACAFFRNLCSLARSSGLCVPPDDVDRKQRMSPRSPPTPTFDHSHVTTKSDGYKTGKARKFSFSGEAIDLLRLRALSHDGVAKCSRFVALAAHMWVALAITLEELSPAQELPLRVPVNVRERFGHAIPTGYVGNAVCLVDAKASVKDLRVKPLGFAVVKIQEAIGRVTADHLQSELDLIEVLLGRKPRLLPAPGIVSLAGFPFYNTDCGWGMPVYLGRPSKVFRNRMHVLAGDAEGRSFNVLVAVNTDEELTRFEDAIRVLQCKI